jgi:hypothetical protein
MYERVFLLSLCATLAVEVPIVFLIAWYKYKIRDWSSILFTGFLATILTLPYLWFVLPAFLADRITYLIVGEVLVFVVEALVYHKVLRVSFKRAFVLSFISNMASAILGLVLL